MRSLALEDQLSSRVVGYLPPLPHVGGEEIEVRKAAWRFFDPFVPRSRQLRATTQPGSTILCYGWLSVLLLLNHPSLKLSVTTYSLIPYSFASVYSVALYFLLVLLR